MKASHSQELIGHVQQSFALLQNSRCAQGIMSTLMSPWFFEEKACTPGLLTLVHLTRAGLEDTIPPRIAESCSDTLLLPKMCRGSMCCTG